MPNIPLRHRQPVRLAAVVSITALSLVRRRDFVPEHQELAGVIHAAATAAATWLTGTTAFADQIKDAEAVEEFVNSFDPESGDPEFEPGDQQHHGNAQDFNDIQDFGTAQAFGNRDFGGNQDLDDHQDFSDIQDLGDHQDFSDTQNLGAQYLGITQDLGDRRESQEEPEFLIPTADPESWWDKEATWRSQTTLNLATALSTGLISWALWKPTAALVDKWESKLPSGVGRAGFGIINGATMAITWWMYDRAEKFAAQDPQNAPEPQTTQDLQIPQNPQIPHTH